MAPPSAPADGDRRPGRRYSARVRLRIAIVGPGRVGTAFGLRLGSPRVHFLGFVGRDAGRTAAAVRTVGAGQVLGWDGLAKAHVVVFAVGDAELPTAIAAAAAAALPRRCGLWLHTSGRHDLTPFDAIAAGGVRLGALHPVVPFADAASGAAAMAGAPGVLAGEPRSLRLLRRLCTLLGLVPVTWHGGDRTLYHAACVLAANGLTALVAQALATFAAAGGLDDGDRGRVAMALLRAALTRSERVGPAAALSGPVRRGDAGTVAEHRAALQRAAPGVLPTYDALAAAALDLAAAAGLGTAERLRVAAALAAPPHAGR